MKKKTLSVAATALAAVMLTTGCGQTASSVASSAAASSEIASSVAESTVSAEETSYPLTLQIYDADGNAVDMTYDHAPEKVLSTQLSMTELLIKLGLKDKIVGVFDNDNALKGDIADEVASLNSLGHRAGSDPWQGSSDVHRKQHWHCPILSGTGHSRLYRVGQCFH